MLYYVCSRMIVYVTLQPKLGIVTMMLKLYIIPLSIVNVYINTMSGVQRESCRSKVVNHFENECSF